MFFGEANLAPRSASTSTARILAETLYYWPLREDCKEIRLLDVQAADQVEAPLRCRLRHVNIYESSYSALSYVWGQQEVDSSRIEIGYKSTMKIVDKKPVGQRIRSKFHRDPISTKHTLPVEIGSSDQAPKMSLLPVSIGSNLANALRGLRQKYRSITIWVDALCIDQTDGEEKSWQVPLMKSIYSKAETVHAWLGPSYKENPGIIDDVNTAFQLANDVWTLAQRVKPPWGLSIKSLWLNACLSVAYNTLTDPQQPLSQAQRDWADFSARLRHIVISDHSMLFSGGKGYGDAESARMTALGTDVIESLWRSAWGMRPVLLDTGRLGYTPEDAKLDDQVVVFHGVKAPLVVRKTTGDAYGIIGPAHVCGVMEGAFMRTPAPSHTYVLI